MVLIRVHISNIPKEYLITLSLSLSLSPGITHWLEVVNSPRQKVSHWHTVVPVERTHVHPAATTADLASVKSTT